MVMIELAVEELQYVVNLLAERPLKESLALFNNVQKQYTESLATLGSLTEYKDEV